jgi:hypothetical protein
MVMGVDHAAVYPTRRAETVRENFMMLLIDYVQQTCGVYCKVM